MIVAQSTPSQLDPTTRRAYLDLIEQRFGLRLTAHQARNLDQVVFDVVARSGFDDPRGLTLELSAGRSAGLLEELAISLSIGETHFFRVGPQIDALRQQILPALIEARRAERELRIWSAGCSTGEEPYTIAILLRELLPTIDHWDVYLLGTDFSRPALDTARAGLFRDWSFRDTPDEVRERYFVFDDRRYRLIDPIRRMVTFEHLNLAAATWPSLDGERRPFDLILCRNVTIYFSPDASRRLNRRLGQMLGPEGWLVLGPSDPSPDRSDPVEPVNLPGAVVWQRPPAAVQSSQSSTLPARRQATLQYARAWVRAAPLIRSTAGRFDLATANGSPADRDRARTLAERGDRSAAKIEAERWVRAWPLEAEAHLLLGMLNLDEGLVEPAIRSLRRAALLDGNNGLVHFNLGTAYLRSGDPSRARAALSDARRILLESPVDSIAACGVGVSATDLRLAVEEQLAALG